jgi:hypothetical protein
MPGNRVGILSLDDLLARRDVTPLELGLDTIVASLNADMAIHNRLTTDMVSTFAVVTTDIRRRYGVSSSIQFKKVDEFGRSHTQKAVTGSVVEFPMDKFQAAIGWTAEFFRQKTVADMAMTQSAVQNGHVLGIRTELQRAIYGAANYTFTDYLATGIDLGVKRFLNADGADIPMGPNGESFNAATHNHYLFSDDLTAAGADALVATVLEHHQNGAPKVFINLADQAKWEALPKFKPYTDARLTLDANGDVPTVRQNMLQTNDKAIGLYGAAEVWIKPWALSDYSVCMDIAAPKPLAARVREGSAIVLRTVAQNVLFPIQAEYMESEFGFGVYTRTNGAVLYHAVGAVAYVEPTL